MKTRLIHKFVSFPKIYDLIQDIAGAKQIRYWISSHPAFEIRSGWILDVGGGTGLNGHLFQDTSKYICLDIDKIMVYRYKGKFSDGTGIIGDACKIPLEDCIVDTVIFTGVSHHIPDEKLDSVFDECKRVLKNTGIFIFVDATWSDRNIIRKILWKYDRGSYPRSENYLESSLSKHFNIKIWEKLAIYHQYILCFGSKQTH